MKKAALVVLAVMVFGLVQVAMAQNPTSATVTISAKKAETLTLTVPGSLAAFTLNAAGTASVETRTLTIGTAWNVQPDRGSVTVCAEAFDLSGTGSNTDTIDATAVQGDAGSGYASINQVAGCGRTAVTVVKTYDVATTGRKVTTPETANLLVRLSGVDPDIQADTYTGTITIYASAQ